MTTQELLAAEFDEHRPRLIGIAYRLTGGLADAEDAVQEAWLRLAASDSSEIRELGAWLNTVVGRLCVDRMRSATKRREHYVGPWLPEPIITSPESEDPLAVAVGREDLRIAALRVLHELTPDQRLAFVLHDGFDVPFPEIAAILGCSAASARQHATRARKIMAGHAQPPAAPMPEQQRVLDELLAAVLAGDVDAIARTLHPEVTFRGDSDGKARTALRPITGADKVARFFQGLANKYELADARMRPVLINGELGLLTAGGADIDVAPRVTAITVRDGVVTDIHDIVNPAKLTRVRF